MADVLKRDVGIDVARAGMVAMMIIYHSFGDAQVAAIFGPYFDAESMGLNPNVNINRWMGLVSGSFPFLIGFLIAFRYFGLKYVGVIVVRNLVIRASKIIGLFLVINVFLMFVRSVVDELFITLPNHPSIKNLLMADDRFVAYDLLMPLGIIVLIGAGMVGARFFYRNDICSLCAIVISAIVLAEFGNSFLIYLACGMAGLAVGSLFTYVRVSHFLRKYWGFSILGLVPGAVLAILENNGPDLGLLYLVAVTGLFLVFHNLGRFEIFFSDRATARVIDLFARWSLLIYLVHIPFLSLLTKMTGSFFSESDLWWAFSAYAMFTFVCMGVMVYLIDRYRFLLTEALIRLKYFLMNRLRQTRNPLR